MHRLGDQGNLGPSYVGSALGGCACVVLKTRQAVTANFWTNVNDDRFVIPGVIEMSNLRTLAGNVSYVPFYIPADHPDYQRPNQAFINDAWACLKAINPQLSDADLLASHCSRSPHR